MPTYTDPIPATPDPSGSAGQEVPAPPRRRSGGTAPPASAAARHASARPRRGAGPGSAVLAVAAALAILALATQDRSRLGETVLQGRNKLALALAQDLTTLLIALPLTGLLLYPALSYLTYSWVRKREEILSSLSTEDKAFYLTLFHKTDQIGPAEDPASRFARIYDHWYGRHRYILPILGLAIAGFGNALVIGHWLTGAGSEGPPPLALPVAAAAGGYTYVALDLILRQQRRDLSASDVLRGALRLAVAIPVGMAVAAGPLAGLDSPAFLAFAVGIFPLDEIANMLRRLANKRLIGDAGQEDARDQVMTLTGIDTPTADRIQQADITTVSQLAWCDPVQLSMRSNLAFSYVLDIVSQALAWVYLGPKLPLLAPLGLRGAVEIRDLMLALREGDEAEKAEAGQTVDDAAATAALHRAGLLNAFAQIADDASAEFLYRTIALPVDEDAQSV